MLDESSQVKYRHKALVFISEQAWNKYKTVLSTLFKSYTFENNISISSTVCFAW